MFISRLFKALKGLSRVIKEPKCSYQGLSRRVSADAACIKNEVENELYDHHVESNEAAARAKAGNQ